MAESSTVQLFRDAYASYNAGNFQAVVDLFDENIEFRPPSSSPEPEPLFGREAAREYLVPNLFDEQKAEPVDIVEEGDQILVEARVRIRGSASGVEMDDTVFHLWRVEGERATRLEVFLDRDEAVAALRAA